MSAAAVQAFARLSIATRQRERVLLSVMAMHADASGFVRRTQAELAQECGWRKVEQVRVVSKFLIERGLLEITAKGQRSAPQIYRLKFLPATVASER